MEKAVIWGLEARLLGVTRRELGFCRLTRLVRANFFRVAVLDPLERLETDVKGKGYPIQGISVYMVIVKYGCDYFL